MFALKINDRNSKESQALAYYNMMDGVGLQYFRKAIEVPTDAIPAGSVEWFLEVTRWKVIPDYYPEFLKPYLGRKIWRTDQWPMHGGVFVKPADKYKRFTGKITTGGYHGKKKGPYWCSEVVSFTNEWRFYVANGKVLYIGWYFGADDDAMPPDLKIDWPDNYCGAVDFGTTPEGKLLLIEANEPFSCGWYGHISEGRIYGKWLEIGYEYMKEKMKNETDKNA
jgi:hypothetical protein